MLLLLERRPIPLLLKRRATGEGLLRGPSTNALPPAHPAPDPAPKKGQEAGPERGDTAVLPAPCPAVQSQTRIPLDLGQDHALHLRKDIVPVTLRAVPAPPPVPHLGPLPLCPAPLPGGGGIRIPPLALARGVVPGHDLNPLRDEDSGVEVVACTAPHTDLATVTVQSHVRKR